jgi:hypothetical protein
VDGSAGGLTTAEVVGATGVTALAAAIVAPYAVGRAGFGIAPSLILLISIAAAAAMAAWLRRARRPADDLLPFAALVLGVFLAILWMARPDFLPIGGGSDLTHHLQLVDYIDRRWRLPAAADIRLIGGMVDYTPGAHLLASLAGAWTRSDGLHAMHPLLAAVVALKAGFIFLIARRTFSESQLRTPTGIGAVLLLFLPFDYFLGSFVRFSFFAQVVAELFAVVMWWALVVWHEAPSLRAAALFAIAGVAAFLTWPVWIGAPVLTSVVLALARARGVAVWQYVALALLPIAAIAAVHAAGRADAVGIVRTGGTAFDPTIARLSGPFLVLSAIGIVLGRRRAGNQPTLLLLGALGLQAILLFALARVSRADTPYMALKTMHLAIYPMAVLASSTLAAAGAWLLDLSRGGSGSRVPALGAVRAAAWVAIAAGIALAMPLAARPPQPPAITEDLFQAGRWARAHVPVPCVEYLVPQDATSYWLHLAVLGNPMEPESGTPPPVFVYSDALVRAIAGTGRSWAIADTTLIPREIREELQQLARFGNIVVAKNARGSGC